MLITLVLPSLPLSDLISHRSLKKPLSSSHNTELNIVVSTLHPATYLWEQCYLLRMGYSHLADLYSSSKTRLSVLYPVKLSQTHAIDNRSSLCSATLLNILYFIALKILYCSYLISYFCPLYQIEFFEDKNSNRCYINIVNKNK